MQKPRKWPELKYGEGSWEWDETNRQIVLRFMLGTRRTKVRSSKSTTDALRKRDERLAEVAEQARLLTDRQAGVLTVNELMTDWIARAPTVSQRSGKPLAPGTFDKYRDSRRIVATQPLGSMPANMVSLADVQDMFDDLAKHYGQSILTSVRGHLKNAYQHAMRRRYFTREMQNPVEGITLSGAMPKGAAWLDLEELPKMRAYLTDHPSPVHIALLIVLLCGLRSAEVLGLQWDAIDWDARTIHVRRQIQRSKGGRVRTLVDGVKTVNSERKVKVPPALMLMLRGLRQERPFGPMFVNAQGHALNDRNLRQNCAKACAAIGVAEVTPHGLRHTNGSWLLDRGMLPTNVAQHLGHTLETFLRTYRHQMKDIIDTTGFIDDDAVYSTL